MTNDRITEAILANTDRALEYSKIAEECICDTATLGYHPGPDPECTIHGDAGYQALKQESAELTRTSGYYPGPDPECITCSGTGEITEPGGIPRYGSTTCPDCDGGDVGYQALKQKSAELTRASIRRAAEEAIALREAVPGMPSEGPYPTSVGEVADELADFIVELDVSCAPGLIVEMRNRLQRRIVRGIKERLKYRPLR
jgi:hypothetical protein